MTLRRGLVVAVAVAAGGAALTLLAAPAAHASCAAPSGTEAQRMRALATGAPTVFVGTVTSRGAAYERDSAPVTPVTFRVAVYLNGTPSRTRTVLVAGGTVGGVSQSNSEAETYDRPGLQLVAAEPSRGALFSESVCYGTGAVDNATVRKLIAAADHPVVYDARFRARPPAPAPPRLPFTGPDEVGATALLGVDLLALGWVMASAAPRAGALPRPRRRAARGRHRG